MSLKVYYLDDEQSLCENFSDYFSSSDVVITTFTNPDEAIQAIKSNPPDLFFIDYRLPNTSGDEVALKLDPKIPKFLVTGDISIETKYKFEKLFSKPYTEAEILEVINRYKSKTA